MALDNEKRIKKEAQDTARVVEDAFRNISSKIGDYFEEALSRGEDVAKNMVKDAQSGLNNLSKISKDLASSNEKASNGLLKQRDITRQIQERNSKLAAIKTAIEIAEVNGVKNASKLKKEYDKIIEQNKEYEKELKKQLSYSQNINKSIGLSGAGLSAASKLASKLGLSGLDDVFEDARQSAVEQAKALGVSETNTLGIVGKFKVLGAATKSLGKGLLQAFNDPLIYVNLISKSFTYLKTIAFSFKDDVADAGRNFIAIGSQANNLVQSFRDIASSSGGLYYNSKEIQKAFTDLNNETGTFASVSEKNLKTYVDLTSYLGLSGEEASKLYRISQLNGTEFENITKDVAVQTGLYNVRNKAAVNENKVLKNITSSSASIRVNLKGSTTELTKAAIEAAKMGASLDQIQKAAENTLNFEESIADEIQSELLLNTDLNLEQLRYAALTGDVTTQTKEMQRLITENKDKIKGNVIAQDQFAKTLGLSREELLQMQESMELQNKLGKDQASIEKAIAYEMEKGVSREEAIAAFKTKGIDDTLKQQKAAQELNKTYEQAKESIANAFAPLAKSLFSPENMDKFAKIVTGLADGLAKYVIPNLDKILAGFVAFKVAMFAKNIMKPDGSALKPLHVIVAGGGGGLGDTDLSGSSGSLGKGAKPASLAKQAKTLFKNPKAYMRALKMGGTGLKIAKGLAGGVGSLLGGAALDYATENQMEKAQELEQSGQLEAAAKARNVGKATDIGSSALTGAGIGGTIGAFFGGIGAVPGAAIGGALGAGYGAYKNFFADAEEADDFIIRPGSKQIIKANKGDVIMGGTNLGGGSEEVTALLRELVAAVKAGGNVYLDATKVGTAMNVGTYRVQ
jgi:hypothetical protein